MLILSIGNRLRTMNAVGAFLLVLAILMSPTLTKWFSHPALLVLGSFSFSMYLLHTMFIRTLLTWIQLGLPQHFPTSAEHPVSLTLTIAQMVLYPLWGITFIYACKLWRDHVDTRSIRLASLAEDIMTGKKLLGSEIEDKV
jgi:peptidoglycan/LPS O-acetylase OafA/YrhL